MKSVIFTIFFLGPLCLAAQKIRRQVIASMGMPHVASASGGHTFRVATTVAQPPNAGTITQSGSKLRQGFQQPPIADDCPISIQFDVVETSLANCGTYYQFIYTGNIDPQTTIAWQFGSHASPVVASGATPPLVAFTQLGNQEVLVTVSNGKCQKTVMQFVQVKGTPYMALVEKKDALCFGTRGNIRLEVKNGTPPHQYKWNTGATTPQLDNLLPGLYAYTVTDAKGCSFSQPVEIKGSTKPMIIESKISDEICDNTRDGKIELTVLHAQQPVTFQWQTGSKQASLDSLTQGKYALTITDAAGCQRDTTFSVRTFCQLNEEEFIPDVFSPNGDGFNDVWVVPMLGQFPNHAVRIYNRWGHLIWEATNGTFTGWDGTNRQGQELQIGAYFYVIELHSPITDRTFKGSVTIIR